MTGLVTVRPSGTPVLGLSAAPRVSADSVSARLTYSWTAASCSVPAASLNTSGCSGAITKKVAPNSVSGRVVNTV